MPYSLAFRLGATYVEARHFDLVNAGDYAQYVRNIKGNRVANEVLLDAIGLTLRPELDNDYYREALEYHLGLLYAHLGQPERAAEHFELSGTLPHAGGNPIFSEQQTEAAAIRQHQLVAIGRGIPLILIASMPRSASASLTQTIAATLDIPVLRVSSGNFPYYFVVPRWLNLASAGGAVTHDHFAASPYNLTTLINSGLQHVFVLVRDPRAAAASAAVLYEPSLSKLGRESLARRMVRDVLYSYLPWLNEWVAASVDKSSPLKIHWIHSHKARADMDAAVRDIVSILAPQHPALEKYLGQKAVEVTANFNSGDDDAWRKVVDASDQAQMWDAMTEKTRALFGLAP